MGQLSIMGREGHRTMTWDPAAPETLAEVEVEFNKLMADGYAAFAAGQAGEPATKIEKFDPKVGEILLLPQVVGG